MKQAASESTKIGTFKFNPSALWSYAMVLALGLIWLYFHWKTDGTFLTAGNLSNLMSQTAVTGILAVGMLMVIVAGQIDLSVGSVLGLAGGIAAIVLTNWNYGIGAAILAAIAVSVGIGLAHGALVAYARIPAFIVTLGGLLAWRGAIKGISESETIPISDPAFTAIGQKYLAPMGGWALAALGIAAVLWLTYRQYRAQKERFNGATNSIALMTQAVIQIIAIVAFIYVMNAYAGVPFSVLIWLVVALLGVFITGFTRFGRYLYAIGGNADAARLSGINNERNILAVYALLGALTGVAAIVYAAWLKSASPGEGVLKELEAIAACVIGGASLMGGRGTVFGACLGALIMASLDNGMSLSGVEDYMKDIIKGSILVAAVGLDMIGRNNG